MNYQDSQHYSFDIGHTPIATLNDKLEFGRVIYENGETKGVSPLRDGSLESFRYGFNEILSCLDSGSRPQLFISLSDTQGVPDGRTRKKLIDAAREGNLSVIPEQYRQISRQVAEERGFSTEIADNLMAQAGILFQSEATRTAIRKLEKMSGKASKSEDAILRRHHDNLEKGLLFVDAKTSDEESGFFVSTPLTISETQSDNDVIQRVQNEGVIPIKIDGASQCGPISAGFHMQMRNKNNETIPITVDDSEDQSMLLKNTRAAQLLSEVLGIDTPFYFLAKANPEREYQIYSGVTKPIRQLELDEALAIVAGKLQKSGYDTVYPRRLPGKRIQTSSVRGSGLQSCSGDVCSI